MNTTLEQLLQTFVDKTTAILKENLVGIYLHGSAAMNCFNPQKSDIDLLLVVKKEVPPQQKKSFMDTVVELNKHAPEKGIELSIVKEEHLKPFTYPTPFDLHFSVMHLDWYNKNPEDYIKRMNGTDKDLAAHITVITKRGITLYGKPKKEVFEKPNDEYYLDSIMDDIDGAEEDISTNTMYIILTLNRVLAFKTDGIVVSKKEGGRWGLANIPEKFHSLISDALEEYKTGEKKDYPSELCKEYTTTMLSLIKNAKRRTLDFSDIIGTEVSGRIDRPMNSRHPRHPDMLYPINYGYVDGVFARDGAEQDVYVLGTDVPLQTYKGKVIAVYHRYDDVEDKWIVSLDKKDYSDSEILQAINFQEQYFCGALFR